jgi:hypothetical protein
VKKLNPLFPLVVTPAGLYSHWIFRVLELPKIKIASSSLFLSILMNEISDQD